MSAQSGSGSLGRLFLENVLLAGVCYCIAALSIHFALIHGQTALFWPLAGICIIVLVSRGYSLLPGIILGYFLHYIFWPMGFIPAAVFTVGSAMEGMLGAWCYKRVSDRLSYSAGSYAEPLAMIATCGLAPIASAVIGFPGLISAFRLPYAEAFATVEQWWLGDALGALVVLPIGIDLVWNARSCPLRRVVCVARIVAMLALVALLSWQVFSTVWGVYFLFALLPLVLIGGAWFGELGAQLSSATIIVCGLAAMELGHGVLYPGSYNNVRLQMFEVYLIVVALTTMTVVLLARQKALRIPGRVLLMGWLLGGTVFAYLQWEEERVSGLKFEQTIGETEKVITDRLDRYVEALTGGAALITVNPSIGQKQWHEFSEALQLQERYPGIRAIEIVRFVPADKLESFSREAPMPGDTPFKIHGVGGVPDPGPAGKQDRFVITHVSPLEQNLPALGLDLAAEPARRLTCELSRDTGRACMTTEITLVQDGARRPGFLLILPVYEPGMLLSTVADRRAALKFWICAPFVTEEFFSGAISRLSQRPMATVFDLGAGAEKAPLFSTDAPIQLQTFAPERTTQLVLAGRAFKIRWSPRTDDAAAPSTGPIWAGAACSLFTLLVAALVVSLLDTTVRASGIAEERTREIKRINDRLQQQFAELVRTQADLVRLQKFHEFILRSVGDGIYAIGPNGDFIMENGRSAQLLGWPPDELIGKPAHDTVHHHRANNEHYPENECPIYATMRDGQVRRVAGEVFWRRDGSSFPVEYTAAPLVDENGKIQGATVTFRDITERTRLEEAQVEMLEKAHELSEMKSRFIGVTSHEFRAPLQVVESAIQLIENHSAAMGPEKTKELYTRVRGSIQRMTALLDDILILNRIDAQQNKVTPIRVDADRLLRDLIDEHRMADSNVHQFEIKSEKPIGEVMLDTKLLHHVLSNLLGNAVRYSPRGSIITTSVGLEGGELSISVADQGIGIPQAEREKIFEAFERGTNVGRVRGTGLGLNIVKRVVAMLGGTIQVSSQVGQGSCFTVVIPVEPPTPGPA